MTRETSSRVALAPILLAALIGGCASMSEKECRTADWQDQGMRDALDGKARTQLEEHRDACAKAGVTPDAARYLAGFDAGLQRFCTPQNAVDFGRAGHYYRRTCPAGLEAAFQSGYQPGRRAYDADQQVQSLVGEQQRKQRQLEKAGDDGARQRLREELRRLDDRLRDAREDLDRAETRLRDL